MHISTAKSHTQVHPHQFINEMYATSFKQLSLYFVHAKVVGLTTYISFYFIFSIKTTFQLKQNADKKNNGILFFDTDFISLSLSWLAQLV